MFINPLFLKDFYKVSHYEQYPPGTSLIFSNFTPRKSRMLGVDHSVFFGLRYFLLGYLHEGFKSIFNCEPKAVQDLYDQFMLTTLGREKKHDHIGKLIELDYLPLKIYALPEKTVVPCGVPALVMFNTHPDYFWLPSMLETLLSCTLWGSCTSATVAREYRLLLDRFASETSDIPEFVDYQAHDFSMRGMFGIEAACLSGAAHLQYFKGTDCLPAVLFADKYYQTDIGICSVPATEHSVMSAGGMEYEIETYRRLINHVYPSGIVSIVSDTWSLWSVLDDILPKLKDDIMKRDGTLVIRPDSGDPADIICGITPEFGQSKSYTGRGLIEVLWDIFGGTINAKGYKQLDPHIGAIYGDSITLDRANDICQRLKNKGFASTNIIFGIGSYTYQYNTRDTLGWAMKSTYCEINGVGRAITKNPVTDDGTKKSHSGILKVVKVEGAHGSSLAVKENCTWPEFAEADNELKLVFDDGKILL